MSDDAEASVVEVGALAITVAIPEPVPEDPVVATARLAQERDLVLARITQMDGDMSSLVAASLDSNADDEHDPEGQTIAYERSQLGALTDRARAHLAEIDAATERLAAGTYGTCAVCGEPIDPARLDARPTADTCVGHVAAGRRART